MSRVFNITFMGSDPIALPLLDSLYADYSEEVKLRGIFTQPDRPRGRGMKARANDIKLWAEERKIPVMQPERCSAVEVEWMKNHSIHLNLVMAYGQLLRKDLIETPQFGTVNFHASRLPDLRGASPIHTAIASGLTETAVTLMQIVPKLDAGPTLDHESVAIPPEAQAPEIVESMSKACIPLIERTLPTLLSGSARFTPQDETQANYCRRINKDDARLDFHQPAKALHDRIRAFQPWPGAFLETSSGTMKIGKAQIAKSIGGDPGTINIEGSQCFVQCVDGSIELLKLQRPGGRMLCTAEFLRGADLISGTMAKSRDMAPLVASEPFRY